MPAAVSAPAAAVPEPAVTEPAVTAGVRAEPVQPTAVEPGCEPPGGAEDRYLADRLGGSSGRSESRAPGRRRRQLNHPARHLILGLLAAYLADLEQRTSSGAERASHGRADPRRDGRADGGSRRRKGGLGQRFDRLDHGLPRGRGGEVLDTADGAADEADHVPEEVLEFVLARDLHQPGGQLGFMGRAQPGPGLLGFAAEEFFEDATQELLGLAEFGFSVLTRAVPGLAVFARAVFARAVFARAVFARAVFARAVFAGAVFAGAVFARSVFARAVFARPGLGLAVFAGPVRGLAVFPRPVFARPGLGVLARNLVFRLLQQAAEDRPDEREQRQELLFARAVAVRISLALEVSPPALPPMAPP